MTPLRCLGLSVLACQVACGLPEGSCADDVDKGDELELEIVERWDESSSFTFQRGLTGSSAAASCGDLAGLSAGDRFELSLDGYALSMANQCSYPACAADFPAASSAHEGFGVPTRDYVCLSHDRKVSVGPDCEVHRNVYVIRLDDTVSTFATPEPGKLPPVVMTQELSFGSEGLSCAAPEAVFPADAANESGFRCADSWVVSLKKR
jgi:hypothetical protein